MPACSAGNWVNPVFPAVGNVSSTNRNPGPLCHLRFSSKLKRGEEIARKNPKHTRDKCVDPGLRAQSSGVGCLSRNDAVGKGERDRPGRSVRRLAEQLVRPIQLTVWCATASAASPSVGRRRERSRRPRSPSSTASFRLRVVTSSGLLDEPITSLHLKD